MDTKAEDSAAPEPKECPKTELSAAMRAKIERNRQRALMLRQARIASRPLSAAEGSTSAKVSKTVDSGAGFFIDEDEEQKEREHNVKKVVHDPGVCIFVICCSSHPVVVMETVTQRCRNSVFSLVLE